VDVSAFVRGSLYLEVRILPAQPASRVFFGSLQGLSKASARRAEFRHRLAVLRPPAWGRAGSVTAP
jgi:hypothetical protein